MTPEEIQALKDENRQLRRLQAVVEKHLLGNSFDVNAPGAVARHIEQLVHERDHAAAVEAQAVLDQLDRMGGDADVVWIKARLECEMKERARLRAQNPATVPDLIAERQRLADTIDFLLGRAERRIEELSQANEKLRGRLQDVRELAPDGTGHEFLRDAYEELRALNADLKAQKADALRRRDKATAVANAMSAERKLLSTELEDLRAFREDWGPSISAVRTATEGMPGNTLADAVRELRARWDSAKGAVDALPVLVRAVHNGYWEHAGWEEVLHATDEEDVADATLYFEPEDVVTLAEAIKAAERALAKAEIATSG